MAFFISYSSTISHLKSPTEYSLERFKPCFTSPTAVRQSCVVISCCSESKESPAKNSRLEIGSPIVVIEAPKMIKTASSVPCLRVNAGLVKPGDVGRIVSRKPKDVWAVRLTIGTYLIDGKYFKPLELAD